MKLKRAYFVLILFAVLIAGCEKGETIVPSGDITRVTKDISGFKSISVQSGFELILSFGNSEKVEVETYENIQKYVGVYLTDDVLEIRKYNNVDFLGNPSVKIHVTAKQIAAINAGGGSQVNITDPLSAESFSLNLSGGRSISSTMSISNFNAVLTGGSSTELKGSADNYIIDASGGSRANGFDLSVKSFIANVSGGSEINLTVTESLVVNASGGSIINYKGSGTVKSLNLSGGSQVFKK